MLVIRNSQMQVMEKASLSQFEEEMVIHGRSFAPRLSQQIGDAQLRIVIQAAIERARAYEFFNRGPIRLFVEITFLCGSAFDTDPQYVSVSKVLRGPGSQMERAQKIHEGQLEYLEKVSGPRAERVIKALKNLLAFAQKPLPVSHHSLIPGVLGEIHRIFPERAAFIGDVGLTNLIHEGIDNALSYGFSEVRQQVLIVVLMFAFGHGCTEDPLYPWIERTLTDPRIIDSTARAKRLEQKAVTWLEHVLDGEGARA